MKLLSSSMQRTMWHEIRNGSWTLSARYDCSHALHFSDCCINVLHFTTHRLNAPCFTFFVFTFFILTFSTLILPIPPLTHPVLRAPHAHNSNLQTRHAFRPLPHPHAKTPIQPPPHRAHRGPPLIPNRESLSLAARSLYHPGNSPCIRLRTRVLAAGIPRLAERRAHQGLEREIGGEYGDGRCEGGVVHRVL